jgi:hypothetical protein
MEQRGTAVAQWLRYCATNWKVAGSIPDGVIGIFHWHNPSDRTMALGSTQPLTELSTRSISWRWRQPVRKADNLTTILCRCHVMSYSTPSLWRWNWQRVPKRRQITIWRRGNTQKNTYNLGTLTSWNPLGHSRPVTGLLCLLHGTETFGTTCYLFYGRCAFKMIMVVRCSQSVCFSICSDRRYWIVYTDFLFRM